MPTSILVWDVIEKVMELKPNSILDIGCGFGKYGFLCREYLDIWERRYEKKDWKVIIDGCEVFEYYITPCHRYVYNNIFFGNIFAHLDIIKNYDVVIICDVVEHFQKEEGKRILDLCNKYIVTTPLFPAPQGAAFGNEYEKHISSWEPYDFFNYKIINTNIAKESPILMGWKLE